MNRSFKEVFDGKMELWVVGYLQVVLLEYFEGLVVTMGKLDELQTNVGSSHIPQ